LHLPETGNRGSYTALRHALKLRNGLKSMTSELQKAVLNHLEMIGSQQYKQIAAEAGVTAQWIRELANGNIVDAGAYKLERLHKHFTGNIYPVSK
jgi:hypothetical protein